LYHICKIPQCSFISGAATGNKVIKSYDHNPKKNGRRHALPSDFLKELISMLQLEMSKIPGAQDWADGRR